MREIKEDEGVCGKCRGIFNINDLEYVVVGEEQSGFQFHSTPIYGYRCNKHKEPK